MQELRAHHQVFVEILGLVGQVGANPAHAGGQVDDQIGPGVVQHFQDRLALHQVVVLAAGDEDMDRASLPQLLHHEGAEEAGPAGDGDALVAPEGVAVGPGPTCGKPPPRPRNA